MSEDATFYLFCLSPAAWIIFAFWTQRLFLSKGYQRVESILLGLLTGPVGVIVGYLIPHSSEMIRTYLRELGIVFALSVFTLTYLMVFIDVDIPLTIIIGVIAEIIIVSVWYLVIKRKYQD
jgi:hypothetical protein